MILPVLPSRTARTLALLACVSAGALFPEPCRAHDLWVLADPWNPAPGVTLRLDLATGVNFPASEAALAPERVTRAVLHAPGGPRDLPAPRIEGKLLRYEIAAGPAGLYRVAVETLPRFIRLSAGEFEGYLREDGIPRAAEERRRLGETGKEGTEFYAKYAQVFVRVEGARQGTDDGASRGSGTRGSSARGAGEGVVAPMADAGSSCCRPLGQRIEIVPDSDPTLLRVGQSLGVQILYAGRPAAGLQVRARTAGDPLALQVAFTDDQGRASFAIERAGPWALMAIQMERRRDRSEADWDSHWASLTFAVP